MTENKIMDIRIQGFDFEVEESDHINLTNLDGLVQFGNKKILISAGICFEMQRSTLLHEVIEAINGLMQLELEHNKIMSLEAGLNQVFSDNEHFAALWTWKEEDKEEEEVVE